MIKNKKAFSLIELAIVLIILSLLTAVFYAARVSIASTKLANAINVTVQSKMRDDDNLVLWLETSMLSKEKKNNETIQNWRDSSKNAILFEASSSKPVIRDFKAFEGIKSLYFNGSNYLQSDRPLNLSKYTAFLVSQPEVSNETPLFDTGLAIKSNEISNNKIVAIKNDGVNKYIKKGNKAKFVAVLNSDNLNTRPGKFYIGNGGFKGEILEIIIFDRILNDKEVNIIENYLYDKYIR